MVQQDIQQLNFVCLPLDQQEVDSQPDRSSPIGVSTKHAGPGITWPVSNSKVLSVDVHREGMIVVVQGKTDNKYCEWPK
jgi:hypothetical protein